MEEIKGKLLIFSAPSGSGKTTIIKEIVKEINNLEFSISACSRQPREGEIHGKDYYFLSASDFRQKIDNEEFVEWEEVYKDVYYGTLKSEISRIWNNGNHVIFDVDVLGGVNLKKQFGEQALSIFIQPPSIEVLRQRLEKRATELPQQIEKRINRAEYELSFATKFDTIIMNDDLTKAIEETLKQIRSFMQLRITNYE